MIGRTWGSFESWTCDFCIGFCPWDDSGVFNLRYFLLETFTLGIEHQASTVLLRSVDNRWFPGYLQLIVSWENWLGNSVVSSINYF